MSPVGPGFRIRLSGEVPGQFIGDGDVVFHDVVGGQVANGGGGWTLLGDGVGLGKDDRAVLNCLLAVDEGPFGRPP